MRRTVLLLCAAVPLLFAPPALATDGRGQAEKAESVCRPPEVDHSYRTDALSVHVKLPASGCSSREHSLFYVSAGISRTDVFGPQESVWRSVRCGPFMSAEDRERFDMAPGEYFCELDVTLGHQPVETSDYEVEVTYPGATEDRTLTLRLACTSDGYAAVCDKTA
jgi:hypothetical protein